MSGMPVRPLHVLKTSLDAGTYVLEGTIAAADTASPQLVVSTSEQRLKQYDCRQFAHVRDIFGHTAPITDVDSRDAVLVSSQNDTGVMITDLRSQVPAHFLHELRGEGVDGNSVAISPSGTYVAVAAGCNVHIVDVRTWNGVRVVKEAHMDVVTKVRFVTDGMIVSGGEDNMINFYDTTVKDDDSLRCAVNCGECLTRITVMPNLGRVGVSGSCEGAYLFQVPTSADEDFPPEITIRRGEDFAKYIVDWIEVAGESWLVRGHNSAFDDFHTPDVPNADAAPAPAFQPLQLAAFPTRDGGSLQFEPCHSDVVRLAKTVQNRIVTAGEDGTIAVWSTAAGGNSAGSSGSGAAARPIGHEADADDAAQDGSLDGEFGNASGGRSDTSGSHRTAQGGRQRAHRPRGTLPF